MRTRFEPQYGDDQEKSHRDASQVPMKTLTLIEEAGQAENTQWDRYTTRRLQHGRVQEESASEARSDNEETSNSEEPASPEGDS
jgi:hypothetical protein